MTRARRYFKNDEADINHLVNMDYFITELLENDVLYSALHGMLAAGMHFKGDVKVHNARQRFIKDGPTPNIQIEQLVYIENEQNYSYLAFYEESDYQLFKSVLTAMENEG